MKKIYALAILSLACLNAVAQLNMQFRSQLTYPGQSLANICGYVDTLGNEYALVGTSLGVSIVDVTNPVAPIQKFMVTGTTSSWREIKTWGKFAYVTTEGCCNGLQIINLSNLPASVSTSYWTGSGAIAGLLQRAHSLHIDNGYLYLNGSNLFGGACIIASLANPLVPVYMSNTQLSFTGNTMYVHDCYVRNDTMFGAHIYAGLFSIINVTNKSAPVLINTQNTPNNFTHNCWLSNDGRKLFTTDETNNSFLAAYDISNPGNITLLDKVQSNPGSNSIVHNTHNKNNFEVTSWYKDGVVIVDAQRPDNMIITGNYDTYTQGSGSGFNGCWGVYPFLPSGNIIASDIDNGLFVITPTYVRACYLEGNVINSCSGVALSAVTVQITGSNSDISNITGAFKTGTAIAGSYTVTFSKTGFIPVSVPNVSLTNGNVTTLNISLTPLGGITSVNPAVTNVACNGQNTGSVAISPSGGSGPFQYQWSNGSSSQNLANVPAGTYTITVTDATGCSLSAAATVTQPAPLVLSPSSNSPLCDGGTLSFTSAGGFTTYSWSGPNGFTAASQNPSIPAVQGNATGAYLLTVTNSSGCSNTAQHNVQVSDLTITGVVTNVTCYNTFTGAIDVSVGGGVGNNTYHWSNNQIIQDVTNKKAGTYTITVTDAIGCTATKSFTVTQAPSALLLSTSKTNVRCHGANSGIATVNPSGGLPPYTYSWNTNPVSTVQSISGLHAGNYTASVTDAAGCIKLVSVFISQPPQFIANATQTNVTFPGGNNGSASVFPTGGTPPYTYSWNTIPIQTGNSIVNLTAGVYKCKVTDSKGCVKNVPFTITEPFSIFNKNHNVKPAHILFPNPARDLLTISNIENPESGEVTLYDIAGRKITAAAITKNTDIQIDVAGFERGIYLVEIKSAGQSHIFKVVLQN